MNHYDVDRRPEDWYGHEGQPRAQLICSDCGRSLRIDPDSDEPLTFVLPEGATLRHVPTFRDRDAMMREEREAAKAARLAEATPYKGRIAQCQASVPMGGRYVSFRRCMLHTRFVVKRGDDVIATCRKHAEDRDSRRYEAHSKYDGASAVEQVEEEYR